MKTGLIGLGAIGTPIAHKQFMYYKDEFVLLASEEIKQMLSAQKIHVNSDLVNPLILSDQDVDLLNEPLGLIIICITQNRVHIQAGR